MKVVGLTGGIGSGKSTVATMFSEIGIPVFISDDEGKRLLNTSKVVRRKVISLLGNASYKEGVPDRKFIASRVFNDKELLAGLNGIIHPKVAQNFKRWSEKQNAPYCIKESAILFETGGDAFCDATITVEVPLETRIQRVLQRDNTSLKDVEARLRNQADDAYRRKKADYVITNVDLEETKVQVKKIYKLLLGTL
ncbi:putative dephospho-CoA kinase [unidentified eubacterium SCB49]|nr:putative dephospho-CoA kinase [unidentified eubacterium SCB49]